MSSLAQVPRRAVVAWLLVALTLAGGVFVRVTLREPKGRTPDEQFYTAYAVDVSRQGLGAVRETVRLFNTSPRMRKYPRPTRVGAYLPSALLMRLTGERSVKTPSALSTAVSLVGLALCLVIGARRFGVSAALCALLFLAASPLELAMARRAWVDALLGALTLGMIVAYGRLLARPARVWALVAFVALGAWGFLVKESGAVALGLGCLGLALDGYRATGRVAVAARPLAAGLLAGLAAAALLAWLCGGVAALAQVYRPLPGAPPSVYLAGYDSGGPSYYVVGLLLLQPVPFVLGVVAAVLVALRVRLVAEHPTGDDARRLLLALAVFVLAFGAVVMTQDPKNMRLLSPILVPLYLLAGALVSALLAAARRRWPGPAGWAVTGIAGAALAVAAFLDLDRFVHYFLVSGVPDLATPWLLQVPR